MMPIDNALAIFRYKRGDSVPFFPYNRAGTRRTLAEAMGQGGYKVGAEVGVWMGGYSKILCESIPGLKLYCVDPWKPFMRRMRSIDSMEKIYQAACRVLSGFNVEIMRMTSLEASSKIPDGSLDFVYIDAMHDFDNVMMDTILWTPKVRIGGIVAGHDFGVFYQGGVMDAVYAYTRAHGIWMWYVTGDILENGENFPSWFWVRR